MFILIDDADANVDVNPKVNVGAAGGGGAESPGVFHFYSSKRFLCMTLYGMVALWVQLRCPYVAHVLEPAMFSKSTIPPVSKKIEKMGRWAGR